MDFVDTGREVLAIEIEGLESVRDSLDSNFTGAVECLVSCRGRIVTTGIGKSGLVARKIAATFASIGVSATFLHPVEALHGDLGQVGPKDVVLALSNSGETREVLALMPEFSRIGCRSIGLTSALDSSLARLVDYPVQVQVPREACILNLIPTASTTAAMAVGDAFATCLVRVRKVTADDVHHCHPGGALGRRLSLRVSQVMVAGIIPEAHPNQHVSEAAAILDQGGVGVVVVVTEEDGRVVGLVTDGDLRRALVRGRLDAEAPVAAIMTKSPVTLAVDSYLEEAIDCMEQHSITALPVVDASERLVGILHIHDILGKGTIRFSDQTRE
jgi:arabinose-5-phosphate isomerase